MFPGGGAPNMQKLLKQAQQMQADYLAAQEELNSAEVTASAGGGLVSATVSGAGELKSVSIDPKAVDLDDLETLEDLVVAAVAAANADAKELAEEKMGPITQAMSGMSGGLGLPGM
ncbi:YbaB/EbfC family nucleoid-associated protein [Stackebrandtia soli]|uniref:YbaB/EbfC family nucleoid-associated protein n=1 Tax=Stackebrandtia soli TaxID=1892856 RepID=UPI0039E8DFEF